MSEGRAETPHAAVPCIAPGAEEARRVKASPRIDAFFLSGAKQVLPGCYGITNFGLSMKSWPKGGASLGCSPRFIRGHRVPPDV